MGKLEKKAEAIKAVSPDISVREERGCIVLEGEVDSWDKVVAAGRLAVDKKRYLGVVNNVRLKGFTPTVRLPKETDDSLEGATPDVLIVGGGVVGCAIARELARYKLNTMLVEKEYDVACAASSRNDGCVHVGMDLKPGQVKLKYTIPGNVMYGDMCGELEVPFERKGHTVMFYKNWEKVLIVPWLLVAAANGIKGGKYIGREKLLKIEPEAPDWCKGAMFFPSGGIVSPYKLTVALAENAAANGVKVQLNTAVLDMKVEDKKIVSVTTNRGTIYPKLVINAAGVYSDTIAELAGDRTFTIHPRKGTNLIMDKKIGHMVRTSMTKSPFSVIPEDGKVPPKGLINKIKDFLASANSKSHTKGGGVIHTADNNVLVGPNALETPEREDYSTEIDVLNAIFAKQKTTAQAMKKSDIITYFTGVRAATYEEDFVVRKGVFTDNIIEAAGIQSPGLTAAPAIAKQIGDWTAAMLGAQKNEEFNPIRRAVPHLAAMTPAERNEYIKKNPDYGVIVCRCEEVSKGEIIDALNSPVPVYSVDAIKRRVRPGMGRCQGGFCSPLVLKIIAEEEGCKPEDVVKGAPDSNVLFSNTKNSVN